MLFRSAVKTGPRHKTDDAPDLFSQLVSGVDSEVADKIRALDINTLTPIEAMNMLFEYKKLLS